MRPTKARRTSPPSNAASSTAWSDRSGLIALDRRSHHAAIVVELGEAARCSIVEELALGRHDEPAGQLDLTLRVRRAGRALIAHSERFGPTAPGAGSFVSVGEARHVICVALVGPAAVGLAPATHVAEPAVRAVAALPITPDAAVVMASTHCSVASAMMQRPFSMPCSSSSPTRWLPRSARVRASSWL
ncbi:MAG: hypothetical protein HRT86_15500 [Ilumatobacteraceae bacterium]|nr:hypothetical protein [Ilumatobacteraceae bacterium]